MLPWGSVVKGSLVILPEGREALVTAVGEPFGSVREVSLTGHRLIFNRRRVVDTNATIPVIFNDKSKAMMILISVFGGLEILAEEDAA